MFSAGTPAAAKRSTTLSSTPHVTGLMKPSGGGGEYEALIFRIWATSVGSPGIQLPITIRPAGFVTRAISLATSNGLGANIAPKMLTTRSKLPSSSSFRSVASPSWNRQLVSPRLAARALPADEVARDVDAEDVRPELRRRQRRRAVAAPE